MGPPEKDRRSSPRQPPSYTPEQIDGLRLTRLHFREDYLFCVLSDGNILCVPLTISPDLMAAPKKVRYQWRIVEDGKVVIWPTRAMGARTERLSLQSLLNHPEAQITELPKG